MTPRAENTRVAEQFSINVDELGTFFKDVVDGLPESKRFQRKPKAQLEGRVGTQKTRPLSHKGRAGRKSRRSVNGASYDKRRKADKSDTRRSRKSNHVRRRYRDGDGLDQD